MTEPDLTVEEKLLLTMSIVYILTMKKRAGYRTPAGFTCAYRGEGCNCPVGNLIKDELYDENFEGKNVHDGEVRRAVRSSHPDKVLGNKFFMLLRDLQWVHDSDANWDGGILKLSRTGEYYIGKVRAAIA